MKRPRADGAQASPLLLEPLPTAVGEARRYLRRTLVAWGYEDLVDSAELGVSELVTNATIHARTVVAVRVRDLGAGTVRIEVADASPVLPSPSEYGLTSSVGRGLRLLQALGDWGVEPVADAAGFAKVVWFEPGTEVDEAAFVPDPAAWDVEAGAEAGPATTPGATCDGQDGQDGRDGRTGSRAMLGRYDSSGDDELVTVRMLRFPLRLFAAAREHHDELVRELSLLALAPPGAAARPLPNRLVALINTIGGRYRAVSERADAVRDAAMARGELSIDLTYRVPASAKESMVTLAGLMDEANEFCRDEQLLTMAESPLQEQFRRWFATQFVGQIEGDPASAWPGPLVDAGQDPRSE